MVVVIGVATHIYFVEEALNIEEGGGEIQVFNSSGYPNVTSLFG